MSKTPRQKNHQNTIHVFDYDPTNISEKAVEDIATCIPYKETPTVTWINIDNVPPFDDLNKLRLGFDLHPVIMENILDKNERPKIEIFDSYLYLTLKMISLGKNGKRISTEQISIIIANKFLITFQQGIEGDTFDHVRTLLRQGKSRIRSLGTDYLCYELMDSIVTNYFKILEDFGDKIEDLEEELVSRTSNNTLPKIYTLKREVLNLRKAIWPLREAVSILERGDTNLIQPATKIYLRDIYERLIQAIDTMETYRDILSSMLEIYLSSINNRISSVMKILTIITTIFMPLSFLAGFYGMNFKFLPGLSSIFGPIAIFALMITIVIIMLAFFKRKGWF